MLEFLFDFFQDSFGIWAVFIALVLCGLGVPVPEDILLLAAGMLSADAGDPWMRASFIMWFGVLAGDSLIFLVGRHFGCRFLSSRWGSRLFPPEKQARAAALLEKRGSLVFFVARFLPGLRAPIFATAGAMQVRYLSFAIFDGMAATISVPVFVWLGHWLWRCFGEDFSEIARFASGAQTFSMVAGLVLVAAFAAWFFLSRRKEARGGEGVRE